MVNLVQPSCPSCGARLSFLPGTLAVRCSSCGSIAHTEDVISAKEAGSATQPPPPVSIHVSVVAPSQATSIDRIEQPPFVGAGVRGGDSARLRILRELVGTERARLEALTPKGKVGTAAGLIGCGAVLFVLALLSAPLLGITAPFFLLLLLSFLVEGSGILLWRAQTNHLRSLVQEQEAEEERVRAGSLR
jgi:LSD1 subclass zinc finger protein